MSIPVVCQCGKKFQAKDEHAGLKTKCPVCGQPLTIPRAGEKPAASAAPPAPAAVANQSAPSPKAAAATAPPSYEGKRVADWLDLLQVDDPAARKHAAEVLSHIGPEAGAELSVIIERLGAEHVLLRHWAVTCLERIGPAARAAVDALVERLDDDEPLIREKSAVALEKVEPACAAFVSRLRRGLGSKDASVRSSAIATFRREMKTLGVSRCRFWACGCGSVYEKEGLDDRLKSLADGADADWQGTRGCKKCGKSYAVREIYFGKHDVPQKFWPQLVKRFGDRVHVPDNLLADVPQEAQSYQISDSQMFDALTLVNPGGPSSLPVIAESSGVDGYALAEPPPVQHAPPHETPKADDNELVPGAKVPKSGQYKCAACHKVRISESKSGLKLAVQPKTVLKYFKAGKTFAECTHCGDLTEWVFVE
ncbi:MAG TPA: HEAT repeat domain-containing protein [Pirellulales bacterium]|nr:HEAT repeat domain-containing protein [Pirellulales bacterium]